MKNFIFLLAASTLAFSCNKKLEDSNIKDIKQDSQTVNSSDINIEEIPTLCYFDDMKNDSVYLKISDNLGTITGKLNYKNAEKDNSTGDVSGFKSGDTLKLIYVFNSEGTSSTREIWFLKKNEKLQEGIGNQDEDGNYTSAKQVKFEGGHSLKQIDCKEIAQNLK
ncbi:hypothetical protein [Frigoriflavimonas asaccharolytica]|uniref:Lipoprotein n=1 Tax=Frigoriflavimonas asaccharolytica TaxID=2735899 RepID=A0A8J8K5J4_9FLAO|nr:hypothetical protein [Frigoriflavimonas asaccharolytica]NRS92850.1 hypothetical protein [Frigoriflavimonas asaccharolytica]